jgi:hypothetical protein
MRQCETCSIIMVIMLIVVFIMVLPSFAGGKNPRIAPINSHPHGKSYGEWAAAWWQWALELPASTHPLLDLGDCSEGQTGHVWFLGGTFASNPGVERDCTIPSGTALFFPLINTFYGAFLNDPPDQRTEEFVRAQVQCTDTEISATIDGVAVHDPLQYCTGVTDNPDCSDSPLFDVQLPEDNVVGGVPEATCDPDDEGCDELVIPE